MTEQQAFVLLNAVNGLGGRTIKKLTDTFGGAVAVWEQSHSALLDSGHLTPAAAENIIHFSKDKVLSDEYNLVQQKGARILSIADEGYPAILRDIPDAPVVLYIQGNVDLLHSACIGMVGSRIASHYGLSTAERFAGAFAQAGLTVVSGLARGIDTASHRGCLNANGKTIAVIGCGLNHIYPKENWKLLQAIAAQGAVVSELPMNALPLAMHFPRRNRIISGLSLGVLVVEAAAESGALITVDYALEQGKDVFAVPANIDYTTAEGSNKILKDGAKMALSPADVLEEIKGQVELVFPTARAPEIPPVSLSEAEMAIYRCLGSEPVHVDQLLKKTRETMSDAFAIMLNLELKGIVRQLPGRYYVKI